MKKTRIWLDTDIGGDIDDALALALIMKSPELELAGVTTSFNHAEKKARIARRLLDLGGFNTVPVYAGQDRPLLSRRPLTEPCQYDDSSLGEIAVEKNGVERMAHSFLDSGDRMTLVTIGSLTNAALMLMLYPETADRIKRIVMMGGNYYTNAVECNIAEDALAADYVFSSGIKIAAVGTDVTDRVVLSWEETDSIKNAADPVCGFLAELMERWGNYRPTLHDPLAVMYIIKPELLAMQAEEVKVVTESGPAHGMTVNLSLRRHNWGGEAEHPNVLAAKDVYEKGAVSFFMERLIGV